MPFTDQTEYPRGTFYNTLAAERSISTTPIKVSSIVVANDSAGAVTVTFQTTAGATILILKVPANSSVEVRRGFQVASFKVLVGVATTHVSVFYFTA